MRTSIAILVLLCSVPSFVYGQEGIKAGEEFTLAPDAPGKGLQGTPAVAFGQGGYTVVWREGWHGKGGKARIYAARLPAAGKLALDVRPIELAPAAAGVQEYPRIAFGGGVFLVVWQDLRNGKDYDVLGARISPDGKVLDSQPIAIAASPRNQVLPDVASDGKNFVVVWQGLRDEETAYRGFAANVSSEGRVGPVIETGMTPQPKIAWNGSHYLVASGGIGTFAGALTGVRLDAAGQVVGKPVRLMGGTKAARFAICGIPGKGWLLTNHRSPPDPWGWGGPGAIRCAVVNSDGQLENPEAIKEPGGKERPASWLDMGSAKKEGATWPWGENAIAFDGRQCVAVWQRHHLCGEKMTNFENCDLIAARVEGSKTLDPAGVPLAASESEEKQPALASDGTGDLLLVYEKCDGEGKTTVCARRLSTR